MGLFSGLFGALNAVGSSPIVSSILEERARTDENEFALKSLKAQVKIAKLNADAGIAAANAPSAFNVPKIVTISLIGALAVGAFALLGRKR